MEAKKRIKKSNGSYKKLFLIGGIFFGISIAMVSIYLFCPFWEKISWNQPTSLSTPPKENDLDLSFTFYRTLTEDKGKKENRYTIQVGAFKHEGQAKAQVAALKKKGYSAYLASSGGTSRESWHRVRIGYFPTKESAKAFAGKLEREEKLRTLVIRRNH